MVKPTREIIVSEIKRKGLTAYEISKDLPLSEAGINKILTGKSAPRESTLILLQDYLFSNKMKKEKFFSVDDAIAKRVYDKMEPDLEYLKKNSLEINQALAVGLLNLDELKDEIKEMKKKIDFIFKSVQSE